MTSRSNQITVHSGIGMRDRMVWIDLEMTGLDLTNCSIIEIATLVTDSDLNILAEGPNLALTVPEASLEAMDDWNTRHHTRSGLVDRVRASSITSDEAERRTLEFLEQWVEPNTAPLCGNSIWNDKRFLEKEMPALVEFLHYRLVDVSTLKELARRWRPDLPRFRKRAEHLALDDIRESVAELAYYREHMIH